MSSRGTEPKYIFLAENDTFWVPTRRDREVLGIQDRVSLYVMAISLKLLSSVFLVGDNVSPKLSDAETSEEFLGGYHARGWI